MRKGRILLADNHPDFLESCSESLTAAGYSVLEAGSPAAAHRILTEEWVHLAVLDLRLEDDDDEMDKSGLVLARMVAPAVPKIILTAHPSIEDVRGALLRSADGMTSAVDFIQKSPSPKPLLSAMERAFLLNVRVNMRLDFEFGELGEGAFFRLAHIAEGGGAGELLPGHAAEIEDLFRRLFYDYEHVKLDRLLWQHERRAALTLFAFAEGEPPEPLVVVCGPRTRQLEELRRFGVFAPKTPSETGTFIRLTSDTTHFAANAYALPGADLESVTPLADLYQAGPEKLFNTALTSLFQKTLAAWQERSQVGTPEQTLADAYRERADARLPALTPQTFVERLDALARQTPILGLSVGRSDGMYTVGFDGQCSSYPDPVPVLFGKPKVSPRFILVNSPGFLAATNILVDPAGRAWLTDFADAGLSPLLWHYVALESAIRFDWTSARQLKWLHHMESFLVDGAFGRLHVGDVEQPLRRALRAIQSIRRAVPRATHKDPNPYHLGILFQAAARFAEFNPELRPTPGVLAKAAHRLIAILIICARLGRADAAHDEAGLASAGIYVNRAERSVLIGGARARMGRRSYELLLYFYDRPNQLCTRRELLERVFKEQYREADASQISRLNTAIHRLRKILEEDPDQPRRLVTDAGGYRLLIDTANHYNDNFRRG